VDPFEGLFGVFSDSLPDGWGRLLVDRLMGEKITMEATFNNMSHTDSLEFWLNNSECDWDKTLTIKDKELTNPVLTINEKITGKWLREWMALIGLEKRDFYLDGEKVSPELLEEYKSFRNLPLDEEEVSLRYGVVVQGAALTDLPTEDIFTDSELDIRYNELQETFVKVNSPVIILLEDVTHKYYYVRSIEFTGWTKQDNIAVIEDRQKWDNYFNNDSFVMVTSDCDIDINSAEANSRLSYSVKTYMGTKLHFQGIDEEGNYKVYVPARNEEGFLSSDIVGTIDKSNASIGYLPASRKNILTLAFHVWGDEYGWGGRSGLRDCSSYIRDIFLCFGYTLPRNSGYQMRIEDASNIEHIHGYDNKNEAISILQPGDILDIGGHVMIYLGKYEGKHYIISMLSTYVPEDVTCDFDKNVVKMARNHINSLDVHRRNGNTWMEEIKSYIHW